MLQTFAIINKYERLEFSIEVTTRNSQSFLDTVSVVYFRFKLHMLAMNDNVSSFAWFGIDIYWNTIEINI